MDPLIKRELIRHDMLLTQLRVIEPMPSSKPAVLAYPDSHLVNLSPDKYLNPLNNITAFRQVKMLRINQRQPYD